MLFPRSSCFMSRAIIEEKVSFDQTDLYCVADGKGNTPQMSSIIKEKILFLGSENNTQKNLEQLGSYPISKSFILAKHWYPK